MPLNGRTTRAFFCWNGSTAHEAWGTFWAKDVECKLIHCVSPDVGGSFVLSMDEWVNGSSKRQHCETYANLIVPSITIGDHEVPFCKRRTKRGRLQTKTRNYVFKR